MKKFFRFLFFACVLILPLILAACGEQELEEKAEEQIEATADTEVEPIYTPDLETENLGVGEDEAALENTDPDPEAAPEF